MIKADVQLDAKGLACPMPIVKTKKAMVNVEDGQVLEVIATDQGSVADLAAWSKTVGHEYLGSTEKDGVYYHYIRKASAVKKEQSEERYEKTISFEEISQNEGLILDVREKADYASGHIPGAINIPLGQLEEKMKYLKKEGKFFIVCKTSTRSNIGAQMLANAGFNNVYNVTLGMQDYKGDLEKGI